MVRVCDVCVGVVPELQIGQQGQEELTEAAALILPHSSFPNTKSVPLCSITQASLGDWSMEPVGHI